MAYNSLSKKDLIKMCKTQGLACGGNKKNMQEILEQNHVKIQNFVIKFISDNGSDELVKKWNTQENIKSFSDFMIKYCKSSCDNKQLDIIIIITAEPIAYEGFFCDYSTEDRILKNIFTNDYEVFYSGQNQGIMDHKLEESIKRGARFRIYYRRQSKKPFIFLGCTTDASVVNERTIPKNIDSLPKERLQIRLVIQSINVQNIEINPVCQQQYKKAVLQHSNFDTNTNIRLGFYTNY